MLTHPELRWQVYAIWDEFWMESTDLYEPPLDMFGSDAVEMWFKEKEMQEIIIFMNQIRV